MKAKLSAGALKTMLLWGLGLAALVLIVMGLSGAFHDKIQPGRRDVPPVLPPGFDQAEPWTISESTVPVLERFPGTVRAIRNAAVSSRIPAEVLEVLAEPGARVHKDDVLMVLDSRDLQAREKAAREVLVSAQARRDETTSTHDRMKSVVDSGAVSREAFDAATTALRSATAAVEAARQAHEEAKVGLSHASILAPFDGIVIERYVDPGDTASPGLPLLQLYDPARLRLEAHVRAGLAVELQVGSAVTVELEFVGTVRAKVEEIVPQAHTGSRSFLVKATLPQDLKLFPGVFGRLLLDSGDRQRIAVPRRALVEVGQISYVVLGAGARIRRVVVPGETDGEATEILSGLDAGDTILVPRG